MLDRHPLMLPDPARLVIQVFSQAEEILAAQTDPQLLVGGIEAQQNILIDYAETDFRRVESGRVEGFLMLLTRSKTQGPVA